MTTYSFPLLHVCVCGCVCEFIICGCECGGPKLMLGVLFHLSSTFSVEEVSRFHSHFLIQIIWLANLLWRTSFQEWNYRWSSLLAFMWIPGIWISRESSRTSLKWGQRTLWGLCEKQEGLSVFSSCGLLLFPDPFPTEVSYLKCLLDVGYRLSLVRVWPSLFHLLILFSEMSLLFCTYLCFHSPLKDPCPLLPSPLEIVYFLSPAHVCHLSSQTLSVLLCITLDHSRRSPLLWLSLSPLRSSFLCNCGAISPSPGSNFPKISKVPLWGGHQRHADLGWIPKHTLASLALPGADSFPTRTPRD